MHLGVTEDARIQTNPSFMSSVEQLVETTLTVNGTKKSAESNNQS